MHAIRYLLPALLALTKLAGIFIPAATAAPLNIVNPGFEDITGKSPYFEFTFGPPNGWQLYDDDLITDGGDGPTYYLGTLTPTEPDPIGNPGVYSNNFPAGPPEGKRVGIAFNFEGSGGEGEYGLQQTLSAKLQSFTTYQVQVEIGNIGSETALDGTFFPLDGFPGYRVDLLAGGTMIAQDNNSLAGSIPDGEFATSIVQFTVGASHARLNQNVGIRLVNLNVVDSLFPDSDLEVDFDDLRIDATAVAPGDANLNCVVDGGDYTIWADHYLLSGQAWDAGDYSGDGLVDGADYTLWADNYDPAPAMTFAIPEPSTRELLVVSALLLLAARALQATSRSVCGAFQANC